MTGNSLVYVQNENQGKYTKNTHCEKKMHLEIECDTIMSNQNVRRKRIIYYLE